MPAPFATGKTPPRRIPAPPPPEPRSAPADPRCVIENRTGKRIGICFRTGSRCMVLPPFGSREMLSKDVQTLQLEDWHCRGLVDVHDVPRRPRRSWFPSLVSLGVWSIPVFGVAVLVLEEPWLWAVDGVLWMAIGVAGVIAWRRAAGEEEPDSGVGVANEAPSALDVLRAQVFGDADRWLGMALVLAIGVGVPGSLLWAQRAILMSYKMPISPLCQLFLGIFTTFVAVVSTLPALLYFLFQQHRQEAARTTFFREVMRIDGSLQTVTDAEAIYGLSVDEVHGKRRQGTVFNLTLVPVLISTMLMTFGWTAVLLPTLGETVTNAGAFWKMELATLLKPRHTVFTLAFLGAYFFTLNMVFRRYVRADLGPKAYSHISVRIIVAVVLAWVAAGIPGIAGPDAAKPAAMLLVFAFFVGIVPETGLAVIHDVLRARWNPVGKLIPSLEEKDPLSRLEGITLYDRARLLEEGIENVENLAHHDIIELMLRTRIATPRVVDLVDQAILYLHVRSDRSGDPEDSLQRLRRIGVRTATDLLEAEHSTPAALKDAFYGVLGREEGVPRLRIICRAIADDEWVPQLLHWRDTRTRCDVVLTLDAFIDQMHGRHRKHSRMTDPEQCAAEAPSVAVSLNGSAGSSEAQAPALA